MTTTMHQSQQHTSFSISICRISSPHPFLFKHTQLVGSSQFISSPLCCSHTLLTHISPIFQLLIFEIKITVVLIFKFSHFSTTPPTHTPYVVAFIYIVVFNISLLTIYSHPPTTTTTQNTIDSTSTPLTPPPLVGSAFNLLLLSCTFCF